jgi:hypothetical protein
MSIAHQSPSWPPETLGINVRPELELLLCCARTHLDAQREARLRALLHEGIDWDYLLQVAFSHGLLPLLYWHLQNTCSEAVPKTVLSRLRRSFQANAKRNLFLIQELLKLLALFDENDIPALPIKGPVLTALAYENLAFRSFCDLDIMVREQDALAALELIVSQGYQPRVSLQQAQKADYVRSHRAFTLDGSAGPGAVDLQWRLAAHWQIRPSFRLDLEYLWEYLEPLDIAGTRVPSPCPEDLLLVLCVHGSYHGWTELKHVCDVAELVHHCPKLGWRQVMARAEALGVARMLFLGLRLAHDLLGAALPAQVADVVLMDPVVDVLFIQVREWLFGQKRAPTHLFEEAAFHVRTRDRLRDRFRYALFYLWAYVRPGLIPTVEDRTLFPLPERLTLLYYVIRPARMVTEYGFRPLKRALQNLRIQLRV